MSLYNDSLQTANIYAFEAFNVLFRKEPKWDSFQLHRFSNDF